MLDKIQQALGMEKMRANRLIAATVKGDTRQMSALLDSGVDIEAIGAGPYPEAAGPTKAMFPMTPLMAACKWTQPKAVELLLDRGAALDPRAVDEVIFSLAENQSWTQKANDAMAVLEAFIKSGCRFEGNVGDGYMFTQQPICRHERLNEQLGRLCPGEDLDMQTMLSKHAPKPQGRKPGF